MSKIQINKLEIINFNPKELAADFEISFSVDNSQEIVTKRFLLKNPEKILNQILLEIKSKNRILFDDPSLTPEEMLQKYSPITIKDEEQTEEKLYNYFKSLCEKAARFKTIKDAYEHMKLLNEFKTTTLQL